MSAEHDTVDFLRRHIADLDESLVELYRDVRPKNEANYRLYAEGIISMRAQLRHDLDVAMGLDDIPVEFRNFVVETRDVGYPHERPDDLPAEANGHAPADQGLAAAGAEAGR